MVQSYEAVKSVRDFEKVRPDIVLAYEAKVSKKKQEKDQEEEEEEMAGPSLELFF